VGREREREGERTAKNNDHAKKNDAISTEFAGRG
jgi:hypothetical protein